MDHDEDTPWMPRDASRDYKSLVIVRPPFETNLVCAGPSDRNGVTVIDRMYYGGGGCRVSGCYSGGSGTATYDVGCRDYNCHSDAVIVGELQVTRLR